MSNKEKYVVIGALRKNYRLNDMLLTLSMPKSSFFYQAAADRRGDRYKELRAEVKAIFLEGRKTYGYRRVHTQLKNRGITVSEKVIRRLMKEEHLSIQKRRRRPYTSYMGEVTPAPRNLLQRDFKATKANQKWLTDITEFALPQGKVYLSPIIDCYDGMVVSWSMGRHPNARLVNTMLEEAVKVLKGDEHPILHSDRGGHYRWPAWIKLMNKHGLVRSMSAKGCTPDNAACEGFFGRLKNEMFYSRSWLDCTPEEFMRALDDYLRWYNEKRIKMSLGGKSPIQYRQTQKAY